MYCTVAKAQGMEYSSSRLAIIALEGELNSWKEFGSGIWRFESCRGAHR